MFLVDFVRCQYEFDLGISIEVAYEYLFVGRPTATAHNDQTVFRHGSSKTLYQRKRFPSFIYGDHPVEARISRYGYMVYPMLFK